MSLRDARLELMARVGSGLPGLDQLLGGGFPERTVTMVYGPPKSGQSLFAQHFLASTLSAGEGCVFVAVDYTGQELADYMSRLGCDLPATEKAGMLRILDTLSPLLATAAAGRGLMSWLRGPMPSVSPQSPSGLLGALSRALNSMSQPIRRLRIVMDSLTPLFIYNPPIIVARFVHDFKNIMRQKACAAGLITYSEGAIDPQSETILKASVDNLIRVSGDTLSVEGMVGTPKLSAKYRTTERGIELQAG